jgi:hypothetical protein
MLTISDNMRLITADTARVTEIIKSHVPIPNTLDPRDNLDRIRFVTPTNGTKFLPYRQHLFAGNGNRPMWAGRDRPGWQ